MSGTHTPLAVASVAALALVGAGGYLAFDRGPSEPAATAQAVSASAPAVAETEAVVVPPSPEPVPEPAATPTAEPVERPAPVRRPASRPAPPAPTRPVEAAPGRPSRTTVENTPVPAPPVATRDESRPSAGEATREEAARQDASRDQPRDTTSSVEPARDRGVEARAQDAPPPAPRAQEFVVPADSVIGLELDDTVSSETARVEQAIQGRVTRDVRVGSTVVIPAGSRVRGEVTLVESGGRFKERARLGVRFHTLVLDGGSTVPIQTETIFREGNGVAKGSAARIGGSAVGGAIIGAIFGGGKGAAIGAAAGAGAGTAATMATQKSHATLNAGTRLTARLTSPASITVDAPSQP